MAVSESVGRIDQRINEALDQKNTKAAAFILPFEVGQDAPGIQRILLKDLISSNIKLNEDSRAKDYYLYKFVILNAASSLREHLSVRTD
jgi:hypothetical protein